MLMRTRYETFGHWLMRRDDDTYKPGKYDTEPHEEYRMVSADCDQKRVTTCCIETHSQTKNLSQ